MCSVDWDLLVEALKVLAPVGAVLVAGWGAIRAFQRQKVIEKRLEWYERMHALLEELARAYLHVLSAHDRGSSVTVATEEVQRIGIESMAYADRAWLYAGQRGFVALQQLMRDLKPVLERDSKDGSGREKIATITEIIYAAAIELSADLRAELKMKQLQMPSHLLPPSPGEAPPAAAGGR